MTDKDKIDDDKFMRVVKGEEPLKDRPHRKSRGSDNGIISTHGKDRTSKVAQMIKDLDKTIKEKSEDMPVEILVEKDEFGKTRFIIREKVNKVKE